MNVKERVKKFIEHKKLPISKFEEMCDLSNGYISAMRKGFGQDKLNNVLSVFPELNREWLLYGEGEMLNIKPAVMTPLDDSGVEDAVMVSMAEAMKDGNVIVDAKNVGATIISAEVVEEIKDEIREEVIEEIEERVKEEMAIPIITSEIASTPNTNIKKYIRDKGDELKRIYINDLTQGAKVAECVESISMWPTFQPGDWVFVKFIDKDSIIDGKTYYFDLNTLPTMIRKVKIENDKLRLIAKNPNYGDIIIGYNEVNNIANIVGTWRSYFGDQYDEIEAVRRRKDGQIDKLIDQNSKALESIGELIEVIKDKR